MGIRLEHPEHGMIYQFNLHMASYKNGGPASCEEGRAAILVKRLI